MEVIIFCPIFLRNVEYGAIIMLSLEEDMRLGKTFDMDIWILHWYIIIYGYEIWAKSYYLTWIHKLTNSK